MSNPSSSIANHLPPALKPSEPHSFNPATDIPSQAGNVILITGGNSGIGKQTAIELARHGPTQIWIGARNVESGREAVDEIQHVNENVDVRLFTMDLGDFKSVESAAKEVLAQADRLNILMLNAGIFGHPPSTTPSGYEIHFGTNHMGHALFLKLLLPLLLKTASSSPTSTKPRIISTSSRGHKTLLPPEGIEFESLKSAQSHLSPIQKYTQSKLANVVYARQIAAHYPTVVSIAIHPEDVATQLFAKGAASGGGPDVEYLVKEIVPKVGVSVQEGAKNGLWAATTVDVESGRYYEPVGVLGGGSEVSKDGEFGRKLWEWTERELVSFTG